MILSALQEMVAILSHPRVYSFLHIPVQSGSNAVLDDMKREYSIEDFRHLVDYLRQKWASSTAQHITEHHTAHLTSIRPSAHLTLTPHHKHSTPHQHTSPSHHCDHHTTPAQHTTPAHLTMTLHHHTSPSHHSSTAHHTSRPHILLQGPQHHYSN